MYLNLCKINALLAKHNDYLDIKVCEIKRRRPVLLLCGISKFAVAVSALQLKALASCLNATRRRSPVA